MSCLPEMASEMNPAAPQLQQNVEALPVEEVLYCLTITNRRLTDEKDALRKELEDLKLELAKQRSQNLLAQQAHSNHVTDVLSTELTCAICSDIIIEATAIECGHMFCSYCISTWLSQKASCPTCRAVTYRGPIKISKLSSAIESFQTILTEEAQSDRRQLLEDRKAEKKREQEASASRDQLFRDLHQAHERLTHSVRHLRALSPDVNAIEDSLPAQDRTYSQDHVDHPYFRSTFRRQTFTLPPWLSLDQSPNTGAFQNPTRPRTLPLPSLSANNQVQAAVIPPTPSVFSRYFPSREASISDDEIVEMSPRLQHGPPSVSHQFHNRDPNLRRRPY